MKSLGIDPETVSYTVNIVSPEQIRELNKQHLGKDYVTDVLSFPLLDIKQGQIPTRENFPLEYNPETDKIELGDIIINHWAGEDNPLKCAMYLGNNRFLGYAGYRTHFGTYGMTGKEDGMYEVIGHIDIKAQLVEAFAAWNRREGEAE